MAALVGERFTSVTPVGTHLVLRVDGLTGRCEGRA